MSLKLIISISKGILISFSIPFFFLIIIITPKYYRDKIDKPDNYIFFGIFFTIVIYLIIIIKLLYEIGTPNWLADSRAKSKKYIYFFFPPFLLSIFFMLFSTEGIGKENHNFLYPFFINFNNLLTIFFYSFYIYFFFAVYKKEKIFLIEIKKFAKAIIIFFFSLIGFFLCLSILASNISIIRKFFELEIWYTKIFEYPMLLLLGYGFSFYVFNFCWTLYRWYRVNQITDKKVSQVPFKLILTILNYPFVFFCFLIFLDYFTLENSISKRRYELILPFAYIIGTPIFQIYIWFFHEKVADKIIHKLTNKLSYWQKRKVKKLG